MRNEFNKKQDLSQPTVRLQNRSLELSPQQSEIYRNLQAIGPEIAAFYLSGVKVLQDDDLETSSYLLAHIAREIEGGLRDVLSEKREEHLEFVVHMPNGEKSTHEKRVKDTLEFVIDTPGSVKLTYKKVQGNHKASILQSLGVDENSPLAERWISVAKRFAAFAHRHGAWKPPREKEAFVPLWHEFENVLSDLIGNHFNLLNRIDHILRKKPTKAIIETLPNLLASEIRYAYFFKKLDSPIWLKSLKDAGWFDLESSPSVHEVLDETGAYAVSPWYALGYLEKVTNYTKEHPCEETINNIAEIVKDIVTYIVDNQQRMIHPSTVWPLVKIINTLPIEHLKQQHMTFMGWALQSTNQFRLLIENEIEEAFLPKLLDARAEELTLLFLKVMLNDSKMIGVMEKRKAAIVKVCGDKAGQVALKHIQDIIAAHPFAFEIIQPIETDASQELYHYDELLVRFTCTLFRYAEPDSIVETVESLLQESHTIFKQITLNVIKHHYDNLKRFFWEWHGNPLDEIVLKPEIYQLIQANCLVFDQDEIDRILHWIESQQDIEGTEDNDISAKQVAYRKREWLSALMETGNEKVISAYNKYTEINSEKLERPGLLLWTKTWEGMTSPTTIEELSGMSNAQIAVLLSDFKDKGISGPSVPTEEGLAEMLEEYVALNPQRFVNDLQPFKGVRNSYQYWILRGLQKAWRDKREFDWEKLLEFIHQLVSSERFWVEQHETRYGGYSEWIFAVAELIEAGTRDSAHAFDVKLLPLAEKILLILVEKVELGPSTIQDLPTAVVNSDRGSVFSAMMNYALQFARVHSEDQTNRWPHAIKADFTRRLDRSVEPSFEFSFTLGAYLTYLLYLDKAWLVDNIDRIFPKQDEYHWHVAFSGYLLYSRPLSESIYAVLKKHGHYQKALNSDFCNRQIDARVLPEPDVVYLDSQQMDLRVDRVVKEKLVSDICLGWMDGFETLEDESSLIYQLVNSENPNLLSTLIHSFWKKRDDLPEEMRVKVIPTWRALYESLSQKEDIGKYEAVLSKLSGWVALVDTIDAEVLKWLKMSTQYIRGLTDSAFFVEELLPHATKTPAEVGDIYLGMLTHNVYPYHDQEHIQEIIRALYRTGYTDIADRICNLYGEAGFDFLRSLYDENQD